MTDPRSNKLIFLYLSGQANLEEIQSLRKWINSDPRNKESFEKISQYWHETTIGIEANDKAENFIELQNRIYQSERTRPSVSLNPTRKRNLYSRLIPKLVTAIVILTAGFVAFMFSAERQGQEETIKIISKRNPGGQKSTIRLPDGSTVWLNSESTITFPEKFDKATRTVVLSGEGFFDIVKNTEKPFIVETSKIKIFVVGTKFNVNAFPDQQLTTVSLVSGEVRIGEFKNQGENSPVILIPGKAMQYNSTTGEILKHDFDITEVTGWKDGILVLNGANFKTLVKKLEIWYGVKVQVIGHPRGDFEVNGKFQNENMENVLNALQYSRDFEYVIESNLLTLKFKNM